MPNLTNRKFLIRCLFFVIPTLLMGCAGGNKLSSGKLKLSDLMELNGYSSKYIGTALTKKGWVSTTAEDRKSGEISSDEYTWKLRLNPKTQEIATFYYSEDDYYDEPFAEYITYTKDSYDVLIKEAKQTSGKSKLKACTSKSHKDDDELHFYNDDHSFLFSTVNLKRKEYTVKIVEQSSGW